MSIPSIPTSFPALSTGYTAPTLPSAASAKAQAKTAFGNFLNGGAANDAAATGTPAAGGSTGATTTAARTATGAKFHHMLDQALKKSAQGMARNTASGIGVHPDQSASPTNAQAATGHAVSLLA